MHFYYQIVILTLQASLKLSYCSYHQRAEEICSSRIVGGDETPVKKFPSTVALILKSNKANHRYEYRGVANIVSKYWAITAAHCMKQFSENLIQTGFVLLRGNSNSWKNDDGIEDSKDHTIVESFEHPEFGVKSDYDCDIAIVKVNFPFNGRHEKPIPVASKMFKVRDDIQAAVAGWGAITFYMQLPATQLRTVSIQLFPQQRCTESFQFERNLHFTKNMICGGSLTGGKDACKGDSGGPLIQFGVLIGVVSYGIKCGQKEFPGVYTKLSAFQNWLQQLEKRLNVDFGIKYVDNKKRSLLYSQYCCKQKKDMIENSR